MWNSCKEINHLRRPPHTAGVKQIDRMSQHSGCRDHLRIENLISGGTRRRRFSNPHDTHRMPLDRVGSEWLRTPIAMVSRDPTSKLRALSESGADRLAVAAQFRFGECWEAPGACCTRDIKPESVELAKVGHDQFAPAMAFNKPLR